jgi:hypothetical protein
MIRFCKPFPFVAYDPHNKHSTKTHGAFMDQALQQLKQLYQEQPWFANVGQDQFGRFVVYVKDMQLAKDVPDRFQGKQVLVHFADSQGSGSRFLNRSEEDHLPPYKPTYDTEIDVSAFEDSAEEDKAIEAKIETLIYELDALENEHSVSILESILYEIHDESNGITALTNLSARHPVARQRLEKLYSDFGFDLVEEMLRD